VASFTPFTPDLQKTVSITSAVTTARVQMIASPGTIPRTVRVKNVDATNVAFVNFGDATVTATVPSGGSAGSFPVGPGESILLSLGVGALYAASICSAGTPIVYFSPGEGGV